AHPHPRALHSFPTRRSSDLMVQSSRPVTSECRIQAVDYKGWDAQQLSNQWVQLMVVPQNGGRLMQVSFAGHSYLFVNRKYAGKRSEEHTSELQSRENLVCRL